MCQFLNFFLLCIVLNYYQKSKIRQKNENYCVLFFSFRFLNQNICRKIFSNFYLTLSTTIETKYSILILIIFFAFVCKTRNLKFFYDVFLNSHFLKYSKNLC